MGVDRKDFVNQTAFDFQQLEGSHREALFEMADDEDLLDIKYKLKKWENSFVKKNNRKPNKVCVLNVSGTVTRDTYGLFTLHGNGTGQGLGHRRVLGLI